MTVFQLLEFNLKFIKREGGGGPLSVPGLCARWRREDNGAPVFCFTVVYHIKYYVEIKETNSMTQEVMEMSVDFHIKTILCGRLGPYLTGRHHHRRRGLERSLLEDFSCITGFPAAAYAAYAAGRGYSGYPSFGLPYPTGNHLASLHHHHHNHHPLTLLPYPLEHLGVYSAAAAAAAAAGNVHAMPL
ncbi:hypothetical protein C0J52_21687 [Blattella germanica]|nr:hypothetical protein C0J52_21687 [Blattella germanica]